MKEVLEKLLTDKKSRKAAAISAVILSAGVVSMPWQS